jgi:hypothetical protein
VGSTAGDTAGPAIAPVAADPNSQGADPARRPDPVALNVSLETGGSDLPIHAPATPTISHGPSALEFVSVRRRLLTPDFGISIGNTSPGQTETGSWGPTTSADGGRSLRDLIVPVLTPSGSVVPVNMRSVRVETDTSILMPAPSPVQEPDEDGITVAALSDAIAPSSAIDAEDTETPATASATLAMPAGPTIDLSRRLGVVSIHADLDESDDDDDASGLSTQDGRKHWRYDFVMNLGRSSERSHPNWKLRINAHHPD